MALTKVSRGLISTSIVDNGNATAITIDSAGAVTFSENVTATGQLITSGTVGAFVAKPRDGSGADWSIYNPTGDGLHFFGNSSDRMVLDNSGNVGIGVSSATSIVGFNKVVKLEDAANASYVVSGGVHEAEFAVSSDGGWLGTSTSIPQRFVTNGEERMRIDASGNLGIGTATPTQTLHVNSSNLMFTLENTSTNANQYAQQQFKSGTALNYFWGANQNSTAWGGASSLNIQSNSGAIAFFTSGSTLRMRIHETSGNIDIPNGDLTFASGHGIDFSATPNSGTTGTTHTSSLLDDYEEGTWTPIFIGTSGTFTNSSQLGSYTKIGNLIHLTFYAGVTAIGTATGTVNIGNLPYAALGGGTVNQRITTGSCMVDSLPFNAGATMVIPYMSHGATVIQFYQSGSNIGWSTTPVDASFTMIGGISYRTV